MQETKIKVALIVNPIAGMGGRVGLKGTDGGMHIRAAELGATPLSPERAEQVLQHISETDRITFLTAPGSMGADVFKAASIPAETIGSTAEATTQEDTIRITRMFLEAGADLLVFVGGDGTARDVMNAIGISLPVVGVPAGVKVYSGVFAYSPKAAADMVDAFVNGAGVTEEEVLDIDEDAYRDDRLSSRFYGLLAVPDVRKDIQAGKIDYAGSITAEENKQDIAEWVAEQMDAETLYLLGPGTTVKAVADKINVKKTILGIDAVQNKQLIQADLNEKGILSLLDTYPTVNMIITPLGGNGFIIGRGSKPFSPAVLTRIPRKNIHVICTQEKLEKLDCLRVDSGDETLDSVLSGFIQVTNGYREGRMVKVCS